MTPQHWDWFSRARPRVTTAVLVFVAMLALGPVAIQSQAQTYNELFSFDGLDGSYPISSLIRDNAGNLYGTTEFGGSYDNGVVFKVDIRGTKSVLYSFTGGPDGAAPAGGLLLDKEGNLYGTAQSGGLSEDGVVFKLDTSGSESVLYNFTGGTADGCYPKGLIHDKIGNLYGTTSSCGASGVGTVFKLSNTGTETVLHSFAGVDGALPFGDLLMDETGSFYGLTNEGGTGNCDRGPAQGCGVVYKLDRGGNLTLLHTFEGGTIDGCFPFGTPVMDSESNLYGTTQSCGSLASEGIIWKLAKNDTETILHRFKGGSTDGAGPTAGVTMDSKGDLYGDTYDGGDGTGCGDGHGLGCGTVYMLSKDGLILLHSFAGGQSDGAYPSGGVIQDPSGNLYGTTSESSSFGTVWKIAR